MADSNVQFVYPASISPKDLARFKHAFRQVKGIEDKFKPTISMCVRDSGRLYVVNNENGLDFEAFLAARALAGGSPALALSRDETEAVEGVERIALTTNMAEDSLNPQNLVRLAATVENELKAGSRTAYMGGVTYLITQNNFRNILNLVQLLQDKVMVNDARLIVGIDPLILPPHEFAQLKNSGEYIDFAMVKALYTAVGSLKHESERADHLAKRA